MSVPWDARCYCASFVNSKYRCDRRAVADGRCAKHNEPMHRSKPQPWQPMNAALAAPEKRT